jgi:hypothetical protein
MVSQEESFYYLFILSLMHWYDIWESLGFSSTATFQTRYSMKNILEQKQRHSMVNDRLFTLSL